MKTNSIKKSEQETNQKPMHTNAPATKASNKSGTSSSAAAKPDSSNKGKGPKGENL